MISENFFLPSDPVLLGNEPSGSSIPLKRTPNPETPAVQLHFCQHRNTSRDLAPNCRGSSKMPAISIQISTMNLIG